MWINLHLKCPDQGEWVALTAIDSDGRKQNLGYVDRADLTNAEEMADHLDRLGGQPWEAQG